MRSARWIPVLSALLAATAVGDETPQGPFHAVAETTGHPPDTPAEIAYAAIQMPMVDSTGTFLYESQLEGGTVPSDVFNAGLFVGRRGAVRLVARAGDTAPGTGNELFSRLLGVGQIIRPGGLVAFQAEIALADDDHKGGIWTGTRGNLALLVREGDQPPGLTGTGVTFAAGNRYFQDGLHLAMNDSGAVALRAKLTGTGVTTANDQAIFAGTPGALTLVGRVGSEAPDAGGATFVKANIPLEAFTAPSINASGKILFRGHLAGAGVTPTNADAIWFGDPANPKIVVRGDRVVSGPGIPANSKLVGLGSEPPVLNDAGQILFESVAFDGFNLHQAVWLGTGDTLTPIAAKGEPVPGDSQNATFGGSILHLRMNGAGQIAFHAGLSTGATDWGLITWDGTTLRELVRTGDQAIGMPEGETLDGPPGEDIFINATGKVLFRWVTKPSTLYGVWLGDATTGEVRLVAKTGAPAMVDGVSEQIIDLTLFSGPDTSGSVQDGRSSPLGDDGTYAILAQFLDGHNALITNGAGTGGGGDATASPSSVSVGTKITVTGGGFGGGAAKFKPPTAWLTVGSDPRKIRLKVDGKTASDGQFQATLASLPKGVHGTATLHVLPHGKHATEITTTVTIELPAIASLSTDTGAVGDQVTITGTYFGSKKRKVHFLATVGGKSVDFHLPVKTWADGSIGFTVPKKIVPKGSTSVVGELEVENDAGVSVAVAFTVTL